MLGYGVAGIVGLVVIVGIVVAIAASGGGGGSGGAHINQPSGSTNGVAARRTRRDRSRRRSRSTNLKQAAQAGRLHPAAPPPGRGPRPHPARLAETPDYKTNPPTSGNHVEPPYQQADGAYSEMPETIDFVHSLEHGRMEIQYSPDLPEADQLELKGLYDTMYGGDAALPQRRNALRRWRRRPGAT